MSYGISLNSKYIFNSSLLAGFDLGFERLSAKTKIIRVSNVNPAGFAADLSASGQTFLNANALILHPNVGYRFGKGKTTVDLTGGLDLALILNIYEKGDALAANDKEYFSDKDRKTIGTDIRARLQLAVNLKKFGIYSGYSFRLANFKRDLIGGLNEAVHARMIRFGITYRLL
ncbi:hypothetical protein ASG14_11180 [Pedobacter sp. Leaf194]|nr:hypothetical protein ASG14_11180 [Pedobacter sp. Leaf194]